MSENTGTPEPSEQAYESANDPEAAEATPENPRGGKPLIEDEGEDVPPIGGA